MEEEFTKDITPKITKKHLLIIWGLITILLIGIVIWQFGFKKLIDNSYQRGVLAGTEAGKNEINTMIMQQLQQLGGIRINVPDSEGKIQVIFLVPQQINATTTK